MSLRSLSLVLTVAVGAGATAVGAAAGTGPQRAPARAPTRSAPSPADFDHPVDNAWFPLQPGLVVVLRGSEDGEHFRERVRVTARTRSIQGISARVVRDVVRRTDGSLAEKTWDWYAADDLGNVWYFGERTATYDENGQLESREGSWQAGVHGAVAGLVMPADPKATDAYRQEFWRGQAEDQAWIVGFKAHLRTPWRRVHHVLRTFEWSRLEPRVVSTKFYAQGVGIVRERDVAGGDERFAVVAVHHR